MRAWALAILVLSVGLTGCLGGGDDAGTGADDDSGPEAGPQGDQGGNGSEAMPRLRFALNDPVSEVRWENGTFQVTEHSYPKGIVTSQTGAYDPDRREIDITPLVPRDIPVVLTAEVNADLGEGDVDLWFQVPPGEVWASDFDTPYGGYSRVELTVLHTSSEPIRVVLRYDEIDDSESFDYTLQYGVRADPAVIPAGVPTAVPVPDEATGFSAGFTDDGETGDILIWDPADEFLGRFSPGDGRVTLELGEDDRRGEYVVLVAEEAGPAVVHLLGLEQAPRPLRALLQDIQVGTPQQAQSGESEIAWSFQVDRVPLQAGIFWSSSEVSMDTEGSLSSPEGELLGLSITAGPWVGGVGLGMITDIGEPGLVSGTYEARVAFGENAGPTPMQANHAVVFYER